jgi:hypothetical protein
MPFSTACATPLSNFEAKQNYKEDTKDPEGDAVAGGSAGRVSC